MPVTPSSEAVALVTAPVTHITRHVDIYEADSTTVWATDVPVLSGTVNCDADRDEQRSISMVLDNRDGSFNSNENGFWYDKVIKPYRGVRLSDGTNEEFQLGEFLIDQIGDSNFPHTVSVNGRDRTKWLMKSKFALPTNFSEGQVVEEVIRTIATNAGITRMNLAATGKTLAQDYLFEVHSERWPAMSELAVSVGHEIKFDAQGVMVLQKFRDPVTDPVVWRFETGVLGNMTDWSRVAKDDRLYNHISVVGESSSGLITWAEARNTNPESPTCIAKIGERTYPYKSAFVTTEAQAQQIANNFLSVFALESWEMDLGVLVLPWLEQGEVIEILADTEYPHPETDEVTRWRLSSMTIPLALESMKIQARRIDAQVILPEEEVLPPEEEPPPEVPPPFSPLDIAGCIFWFDATDAASITDAGAGKVSGWADKSGNGRNLSQGTAANRPTTGTRTINSLNAIDFDGAASPNGDYLTSPAFTQAQPITLFALVQSDATTVGLPNRQIVGNAGTSPALYMRAPSGTLHWALWASIELDSGDNVDTGVHLLSAVLNGSSSQLWLDGTSIVIGSPGSSGWSNLPLIIGSDSGHTANFDGLVGELLGFAGAMTPENRALIETYLSDRWL